MHNPTTLTWDIVIERVALFAVCLLVWLFGEVHMTWLNLRVMSKEILAVEVGCLGAVWPSYRLDPVYQL